GAAGIDATSGPRAHRPPAAHPGLTAVADQRPTGMRLPPPLPVYGPYGGPLPRRRARADRDRRRAWGALPPAARPAASVMGKRDQARLGDPVSRPLLSVRDLRKHFPVTKGLWKRRKGVVKAVDGISFDVATG